MNHLEKANEYAELADRNDLTAPMRSMNAELARLHLEMHRVETLGSTADAVAALEVRITEIEKALA